MDSRPCLKCGETKPLDQFYKRTRGFLGRASECRDCGRARASTYHTLNREARNATNARWAGANVERKRQQNALHYAEKVDWYAEVRKRWREANPDRAAAYARRYRCAQLKALPMWVSPDSLLPFYSEAARVSAETGVPHHVDHIIPLQHPLVCGLHVPWNLQVITKAANLSKGNRL